VTYIRRHIRVAVFIPSFAKIGCGSGVGATHTHTHTRITVIEGPPCNLGMNVGCQCCLAEDGLFQAVALQLFTAFRNMDDEGQTSYFAQTS
jgi:hypothetical protein